MSQAPTPSGSYQQLPYESNPIPESHPDRMATVAYLSGLQPTPLEHARILELGCASGGNLLCAAETLPSATFVGIDLADNQIAGGNAILAALAMQNVRLQTMSFADIPRDFGLFDFVIAHGLFSWVSRPLQQKLLEVCKRHLAPAGIAYISYNTDPGWRLRGMLRDMMLYNQTADASGSTGTEFSSRIAAARQFISTIVQATANFETEYARVLRKEFSTLQKSPDWYFAHEYLDEHLDPIYFHEFVARSTKHGLSYVGEARSSRGAYVAAEQLKSRWPDLAAKDPIRFEQCVDFAFGRQFRRSLLGHAGASVNRAMDPLRLMRCHLSAAVAPTTPQVDLRPNVEVSFRAPDGETFTTANAGLKIALLTLAAAAPAALSFEAVWDRVHKALRLPYYCDDRQRLANSLLLLFQSDSVNAHLSPPLLVRSISPRPVASPLARWQAANQRVIHNRRHRPVRSLTDFDLSLLPLLDGSRDLTALRSLVPPANSAAPTTDTALRDSLERLAANALLVE